MQHSLFLHVREKALCPIVGSAFSVTENSVRIGCMTLGHSNWTISSPWKIYFENKFNKPYAAFPFPAYRGKGTLSMCPLPSLSPRTPPVLVLRFRLSKNVRAALAAVKKGSEFSFYQNLIWKLKHWESRRELGMGMPASCNLQGKSSGNICHLAAWLLPGCCLAW